MSWRMRLRNWSKRGNLQTVKRYIVIGSGRLRHGLNSLLISFFLSGLEPLPFSSHWRIHICMMLHDRMRRHREIHWNIGSGIDRNVSRNNLYFRDNLTISYCFEDQYWLVKTHWCPIFYRIGECLSVWRHQWIATIITWTTACTSGFLPGVRVSWQRQNFIR